MTKEKNGNLRPAWMIIGIIVIAGGLLADYVLQGASIASNKEDVVELARLNWMVEDDYLACFV